MKKAALASMLVGAALSVAMVAPASAQDAAKPSSEEIEKKLDSHLEAAMQVVEQTGNLPSDSDQFLLIVNNAKNWLIRQNPTLEKDIVAAVDAAAEAHKDQNRAMAQAAGIAWARYLKEDELKEVLAFFKTPAGQKFANYQPRILGESIKSIQDYSSLVTRVIVDNAKKELAKKGHKFN